MTYYVLDTVDTKGWRIITLKTGPREENLKKWYKALRKSLQLYCIYSFTLIIPLKHTEESGQVLLFPFYRWDWVTGKLSCLLKVSCQKVADPRTPRSSRHPALSAFQRAATKMALPRSRGGMLTGHLYFSSHMWLLKFKLIEIDIKHSALQLCWPHFKCSVATCS